MENVAVINRLSAESAIGTDLQPFFANVLLQPGTNFEGVWSRLIIIDDGMLCSLILLYNTVQVDCFYFCFQFFRNLNFSTSR